MVDVFLSFSNISPCVTVGKTVKTNSVNRSDFFCNNPKVRSNQGLFRKVKGRVLCLKIIFCVSPMTHLFPVLVFP